jgi:hypothetical protein
LIRQKHEGNWLNVMGDSDTVLQQTGGFGTNLCLSGERRGSSAGLERRTSGIGMGVGDAGMVGGLVLPEFSVVTQVPNLFLLFTLFAFQLF